MLNKYSEELIKNFDLEFAKVVSKDESVNEYNKLVTKINQNKELINLADKQKDLQLELMNLRELRQDDFAKIKVQELNELEEMLTYHEDIVRLNELNHIIKLKRDIVDKKVNVWKEKYVIKNK